MGPMNSVWTLNEQWMNSARTILCLLKRVNKKKKKKKEEENTRRKRPGFFIWIQTYTLSKIFFDKNK